MDERWQDEASLGNDPTYGSLTFILGVEDLISTKSEVSFGLLLQLYKTLKMTVF